MRMLIITTTLQGDTKMPPEVVTAEVEAPLRMEKASAEVVVVVEADPGLLKNIKTLERWERLSLRPMALRVNLNEKLPFRLLHHSNDDICQIGAHFPRKRCRPSIIRECDIRHLNLMRAFMYMCPWKQRVLRGPFDALISVLACQQQHLPL